MDKWKIGGMLMIAMVTNAQHYDWETWLLGILRSAVQGGAVGALTGPAAAIVFPSQGLAKYLSMMGVMFVVGALSHLLMFLQTHGAPELVTTKYVESDSTKTVVDGMKADVTHTSTVETTTTKKPQ